MTYRIEMQLTDSELLELAAKAAGIHVQWDTFSNGFICLSPSGSDVDSWNPLTDDVDALRLTVKLDLPYTDRFELFQRFFLDELGKDQRPSEAASRATRRAIVHAAAAIAIEKAMP